MSVLVNANEHEVSKAYAKCPHGESRQNCAICGKVSKAQQTPATRTEAAGNLAAVGGGLVAVNQRQKAAKLNRRASFERSSSAFFREKGRHAARQGGDMPTARANAVLMHQSTANARKAGAASFKAVKRSRAGAVVGAAGLGVSIAAGRKELKKAYTPGSITYHTAAAREEGRKKRAGESVARAGAATAVGGAYAGANAGAVARKLKVKPSAVKAGGKAAIVAGAAAAGAGTVSAVTHGLKRKKHFNAAQAGRLEREPAISKVFGVEIAKSAVAIAATAPSKVATLKSAASSQGSAASVPPARKKILTPPVVNTATTTPPAIPGTSTLAKSAFGPTL